MGIDNFQTGSHMFFSRHFLWWRFEYVEDISMTSGQLKPPDVSGRHPVRWNTDDFRIRAFSGWNTPPGWTEKLHELSERLDESNAKNWICIRKKQTHRFVLIQKWEGFSQFTVLNYWRNFWRNGDFGKTSPSWEEQIPYVPTHRFSLPHERWAITCHHEKTPGLFVIQ